MIVALALAALLAGTVAFAALLAVAIWIEDR